MTNVTASPAKTRRRLWPWIAVAGLLLLLAGGAAYAFTRGTAPTLAGAVHECNDGRPGTELADGNHTLIIDMAGRMDLVAGRGGVDTATEGCLLRYLGTPAAVTSRMSTTRALDGQQTATWGDLAATWTYHPDTGLDITIEQH